MGRRSGSEVRVQRTRHILPFGTGGWNVLCGQYILTTSPRDPGFNGHVFVVEPRGDVDHYKAYCEKLGDKPCPQCAKRWQELLLERERSSRRKR